MNPKINLVEPEGFNLYKPKFELVLDHVVNITSISREKILGNRRGDECVVLARHFFAYYSKFLTGASHHHISYFLNRYNHSSVVNSLKKFSGYIETDEQVKRKFEELHDMVVNNLKQAA